MASFVLPFEKPVVDLLGRVRELRDLAQENDDDARLRDELRRLEEKTGRVAKELFASLTPWQKVQLSRHPNRPYTLDYIERIIEDFVEMHGDRRFGDDPAIVAGVGRFRGRSVVVVGHQKGRSTKEKVTRNFGQAHPEGNRKALRMYELAERFGLPVLTFIDKPGAYPGIGAEERGQSEAIGACLAAMARAKVPIVATIIGEGGSGGALALGVANRVLVLEYGTYSVISPEGCASILWKDGTKSDIAAERMKMTAPDLLRLKVVDRIVDEPAGGAHQDPDAAARLVAKAISDALRGLLRMTPDELAEDRYARFRAIGAFLA
ncbi:MAG TPA: acetyl-CoA carboxylase carboxyltransferase subunit alpha [Polyangiaceae bacterium]|nr:acetyl-CoA carboxylase carboxyltransferase subunit alpha [Polyangiaceae bacterium]